MGRGLAALCAHLHVKMARGLALPRTERVGRPKEEGQRQGGETDLGSRGWLEEKKKDKDKEKKKDRSRSRGRAAWSMACRVFVSELRWSC